VESLAERVISQKMHDIYEQAEKLKLMIWEAFEQEQDMLVWAKQIHPNDKYSDAEATFDGKTLRITVKDLPPRKTEVKNSSTRVPNRLLKAYWMGNIVSAIKKLNQKVKFNKALCIIKLISPTHKNWDVDNRAVSYILNALRISEVISGDDWKSVSLLLTGDQGNDPRTEITVLEYPEDVINSII